MSQHVRGRTKIECRSVSTSIHAFNRFAALPHIRKRENPTEVELIQVSAPNCIPALDLVWLFIPFMISFKSTFSPFALSLSMLSFSNLDRKEP